MCLRHDISVRQHSKSEHWAPCHIQTPSRYDWKIVASNVRPKNKQTNRDFGVQNFRTFTIHWNLNHYAWIWLWLVILFFLQVAIFKKKKITQYSLLLLKECCSSEDLSRSNMKNSSYPDNLISAVLCWRLMQWPRLAQQLQSSLPKQPPKDSADIVIK